MKKEKLLSFKLFFLRVVSNTTEDYKQESC